MLAQRPCTTESAVAANGDHAIEPQEFAGGNGLLLAIRSHKFLAAGGVEDGAAPVDDVTNAFFIQLDDVTGDQAAVTPADAVAFHAMKNSGTDHCANAGIHTRCVAAAGKYADSLYCHMETSQIEIKLYNNFTIFRDECKVNYLE